MSLMIVEMLLWVGFGLVLWAMRDDLMQTESELRPSPLARPGSDPWQPGTPASQPQQVAGPIGQYCGRTIHEHAVIDGRHYRFAHVCPCLRSGRLPANQRWVAPGLVYMECSPPDCASCPDNHRGNEGS